MKDEDRRQQRVISTVDSPSGRPQAQKPARPVRNGCDLIVGKILLSILGGAVGGYIASFQPHGDDIIPLSLVVGVLVGILFGAVLFSNIWAYATRALFKSKTDDSQEPKEKP